MQFSMEAKALSIALGRVIGVVQHKSSRPILTCVLMTAEDDGSLHIIAPTRTSRSLFIWQPTSKRRAHRRASAQLAIISAPYQTVDLNQRRGSGDGHLEPRAGRARWATR